MVQLKLTTFPLCPPEFKAEAHGQLIKLGYTVRERPGQAVLEAYKIFPHRRLETEMMDDDLTVYDEVVKIGSYQRPEVGGQVDLLPLEKILAQIGVWVESSIIEQGWMTATDYQLKLRNYYGCDLRCGGAGNKSSWLILVLGQGSDFDKSVQALSDAAFRFCLIASVFNYADKAQRLANNRNVVEAGRSLNQLMQVLRLWWPY